MAKPEESKEKVKAHKLHIWHIQAVRDLLVVAAIIGIFWAGVGTIYLRHFASHNHFTVSRP